MFDGSKLCTVKPHVTTHVSFLAIQSGNVGVNGHFYIDATMYYLTRSKHLCGARQLRTLTVAKVSELW